MQITAIITSAGKGLRAKLNHNKVLEKIDGITVLERAIQPFIESEKISQIIITSSFDDYNEIIKISQNLPINTKVVLGGETRTQSVLNALKQTDGEIVLIHDGARPYVSCETIINCINATIEFGSGITAIPCLDTIGEALEDLTLVKTSRQGKYLIQTPQTFYTKDIIDAYSQIKNDETFTDDAGVFCKYKKPCHIVVGDSKNIKLTYPEDFALKNNFFVGTGFDLHKLVENRKLILGGIEIPHTKGLLGHSDADVLTHAIMDALLSSASLRDIGYHFSDKDAKYKDISSIALLERVLEMLSTAGFKIKNISAVIMAEKPKLSTYVDKLSTNLAKVMHISPKQLGITCTTLEGIGIVGREEGIAVQAYCLTEKVK